MTVDSPMFDFDSQFQTPEHVCTYMSYFIPVNGGGGYP